ncbi:MAG: hypothetical protein ABI566_06090 [Pseudolysinimonas sp.]
MTTLDTNFDFRGDADGGDPDRSSPTLRRYHKALWSRELPSGKTLLLDDRTKGEYLHHMSEIGEFFFSSDSVIATFLGYKDMIDIASQNSDDDVEEFERIGFTMGGMLIFPSNQIDRKWTINMARGMTGSIADRLDLTLECIRRHYSGGTSPLGGVLARYTNFFDLFVDFRGYVEFFLLQDLVTARGLQVATFLPFDDFVDSALPRSLSEYLEFRGRTIDFVTRRNHRIDALQVEVPD